MKGPCVAELPDLSLAVTAHCQEQPLLPWSYSSSSSFYKDCNLHISRPSAWTPKRGTWSVLQGPVGIFFNYWVLLRWLTPRWAYSPELLLARDTQLKLFNSCFISASHPYPHPNLSLRWTSTPEAHDISLQSPVRATTKAINFPAGSQYSLFIYWNIINVSRLQVKPNPDIPRMAIPTTDGRVIWNYHRLIWLETHHLRFNTEASVTPRKIEPSAISGLLLWYRAGIGHSKLHGVLGPYPAREQQTWAGRDWCSQTHPKMAHNGGKDGKCHPETKNGCNSKAGKTRALEEGGNV